MIALMRRMLLKVWVVLGVFLSQGVAQEVSAQHLFLLEVDPIHKIGCIPCGEPGLIDSNGLIYNTFPNEVPKKIIAFIDHDMAQGVALFLSTCPPPGSRDLGAHSLSVIPVDLVVDLSQISRLGVQMIYILSSSIEEEVSLPQRRVVTLTLTDA